MIDAGNVHEVLARHQLVDGYPFVLDLEKSDGIWLYDARTDDRYLDAFTCFASWPMGFNHPAMSDPAFRDELMRVALIKPANADLYTREMAAFVESFCTNVTPEGFPHHFWISGGSLAVENAMKTAFDWKARKLGRTKFDQCVNDLAILHFRQAFHGRSGYTLSVTNTVPDKVGLFPHFDWPRVHNPGLEFDLDGAVCNDIEAEERQAFEEIDAVFAGGDGHVAGILIEPLQGEGGDNHFRPEFLAGLRRRADEHEALLIFDEVQTGFFGSGKPWLWQHLGVKPDVVSFGKKSQVCGIYASERVDEVENNVFAMSSRINSTWGGNLVDMVRARRLIEIILADDIAARVTTTGAHMVDGLRAIARTSGGIANVRGRGSLVAFTLESSEARDEMLARLMDARVLALSAGTDSIRFRLPLVMTTDEVDELLTRIEACAPARA